MTNYVQILPFVPLDGQTHQSYIVPSAAVTLSIPIGASGILMQSVTQNIRFTMEGTAPTATRGFQMVAGDPPFYVPITKNVILKFVRESAGAVLEYIYGQ